MKRVDHFLDIAHKHHIRPLLVLFDSCWDPNPHLGKQLSPAGCPQLRMGAGARRGSAADPKYPQAGERM